MADYTSIPDSAVSSGGLPSGETITALRDNAVAIAEGASGAPRIQTGAIANDAVTTAKLANGSVTSVQLANTSSEVSWVRNRLADALINQVGTYAFLGSANGTTVGAGTTKAGSNLRYAGLYSQNETTFDGSSLFAHSTTANPSGTWRCMGVDNSSSTNSRRGATLWLRIS